MITDENGNNVLIDDNGETLIVAKSDGTIIQISDKLKDKYVDIRTLSENGMSNEQILDIIEESQTLCAKPYLCYITVKPGTELKLAEEEMSYTKNGDVYELYAMIGKENGIIRNDIKEYMKQDCFVSFEFYIEPTAEEKLEARQRENIALIREAVKAEGKRDSICLWVTCSDKATALKYFGSNENVYNMHSYEDTSGTSSKTTTLSVCIPADEAEKYIEIYKSDAKIENMVYEVDRIDSEYYCCVKYENYYVKNIIPYKETMKIYRNGGTLDDMLDSIEERESEYMEDSSEALVEFFLHVKPGTVLELPDDIPEVKYYYGVRYRDIGNDTYFMCASVKELRELSKLDFFDYIQLKHDGQKFRERYNISSTRLYPAGVVPPEHDDSDLKNYVDPDIDKIDIAHAYIAMPAVDIDFSEYDDDEITDIITGDINSDSQIDMTDLLEISIYLLKENELSENQLKAADVNGDGKVDLTDLATMKQYVSKQINSFN